MPFTLKGLLSQAGFALNEPPAVTAAGLAAKAQGPLAQVQGALSVDLRRFGSRVGMGAGYNPFQELSAGAAPAAAQSNLALLEQSATPTEWLIFGVIVVGILWAIFKVLHKR